MCWTYFRWLVQRMKSSAHAKEDNVTMQYRNPSALIGHIGQVVKFITHDCSHDYTGSFIRSTNHRKKVEHTQSIVFILLTDNLWRLLFFYPWFDVVHDTLCWKLLTYVLTFQCSSWTVAFVFFMRQVSPHARVEAATRLPEICWSVVRIDCRPVLRVVSSNRNVTVWSVVSTTVPLPVGVSSAILKTQGPGTTSRTSCQRLPAISRRSTGGSRRRGSMASPSSWTSRPNSISRISLCSSRRSDPRLCLSRDLEILERRGRYKI